MSLYSIITLLLLASSSGQDMREYCVHESFTAQCGPQEVVVMTAANYGRMNLGRCVKKDLGYVGCYNDVLEITDRLCSGRHQCEFRVPDLDIYTLEVRQPCLEELKSYLEATYTCVGVEMGDTAQCRSSHEIRVMSPNGYLASVVSEETGCGTGGTPWVIEVEKGQQVNLTLLDFSVSEIRETQGHMGINQPCHAYAIIREEGLREAVTVCGGMQRTRHLHLSRTNRVDVRLFARKKSSNFPHFVIKYQAVGCADLELGKQYGFKRDTGKAEVTCKATGETWPLRCNGATWTGRVGNCSADTMPALGGLVIGGLPLSFEVSIIIITIIASLISLVILAVGVTCIRRKRSPPPVDEGTPYNSTPSPKDTPKIPEQRRSFGAHGNGTLRRDGNEYACILEMPLPPPPPSALQESKMAGVDYPPPAYQQQSSVGRTYHYPNYEPSASIHGLHPDDPRYFELDPDTVSQDFHIQPIGYTRERNYSIPQYNM